MITWLLSLSSITLFVFLAVTSTAVLLVCTTFVSHYFPTKKSDNATIIGLTSQLMVVYAVLMGFVIFTAINNFDKASDAAEREAGLVGSIDFNARMLPNTIYKKTHIVLKNYLVNVIQKEWPAMHKGESNEIAGRQIEQLRNLFMDYHPETLVQRDAYYNLIQDINNLYMHHEMRSEFAKNLHLGDEVWITVLITTLIILIANSFFCLRSPSLYYIYMVLIGVIAAALMFLLISLDMPYQGYYSVSAKSFEIVLKSL